MKTQQKGSVDVEGIKRCYVGMEITTACPDCNSKIEQDLGEQYLSHPEVGGSESVYFYCDNCELDLILPIKIISCDMVIEYDTNEIKEDGV